MVRDRAVWTRTPSGKDSDVIFSTIGHFLAIFKFALDLYIQLQIVCTSPGTVRTISERPRVLSALSGQITHA